MTLDIWVARRTSYDSIIVYHCYIDNDNTEIPYTGFYVTLDGIILQDDTRYGQYTDISHEYYSLYSSERFEALIKRYYDHKQDMIETVKQQVNQLLLMSIL